MQFNIHEAKTNFPRLLEQAARGEDVIIAVAGKPLFKLVPLKSAPIAREPGLSKGKIWMSAATFVERYAIDFCKFSIPGSFFVWVLLSLPSVAAPLRTLVELLSAELGIPIGTEALNSGTTGKQVICIWPTCFGVRWCKNNKYVLGGDIIDIMLLFHKYFLTEYEYWLIVIK